MTVAIDATTNERVPLESYTDSATDVPRYRVVGFGKTTLKVERVPPNAVGDFYPDHRADCPDFPA